MLESLESFSITIALTAAWRPWKFEIDAVGRKPPFAYW